MVREKEGAKKRREEVHSHRGAVPGDFGEGGSTVNGHQEAGSDDDDTDEAKDEDKEDEEEDVDAMDEDDDDQGRLKIMPPTYIYPDRPVKYHGAGIPRP
jgi:hypothetical protein